MTGLLVLGPVHHLLCRGWEGPVRPGVCSCLHAMKNPGLKTWVAQAAGKKVTDYKGEKGPQQNKRKRRICFDESNRGKMGLPYGPWGVAPRGRGNCQS